MSSRGIRCIQVALILLCFEYSLLVRSDPVVAVVDGEPESKRLHLSDWMSYAGQRPGQPYPQLVHGQPTDRFETFYSSHHELVEWEINKVLRRWLYGIDEPVQELPSICRNFLRYRGEKAPRLSGIIGEVHAAGKLAFPRAELEVLLRKLGVTVKSGPEPADFFYRGKCSPNPSAIPWLIEKLSERGHSIRASLSLAEYGDSATEALPKLRQLMTENDRGLRLAAITATLAIAPDDPAAREILEKEKQAKLNDCDLAFALSYAPSVSNLRTIVNIWESSSAYHGYFSLAASRCSEGLGEDANEVLLSYLSKGNTERIRCWCYNEIRDSNTPPGPELGKLLRHDRREVRELALRLLGDLGDKGKSAIPDLLEMLLREPNRADGRIRTTLNRVGADAKGMALYVIRKIPGDSKLVWWVLKQLERADTIPEEAERYLLKQFEVKPPVNHARNIAILAVFSAHGKAPVSLYRKALDVARLPSPHYHSEYAIWLMQNTESAEDVAGEFLDRISPRKVGAFALAYGRKTGDFRKALRMHDSYAVAFVEREKEKAKSQDPRRVRREVQHAMEQLTHGFDCFLQQPTNLTDHERQVLISNQKFSEHKAIHHQNGQALAQVMLSNDQELKLRGFHRLAQSTVGLNEFPAESVNIWFELAKRELQSAEGGQRIAVIRSLSNVPAGKYQSKALELLLQALTDPNDKVAEAAVKAIDCFGADVCPQLCEAINHKDPFVAMEACRLLGEMSILGKPAVPALLVAAEKHQDWTIRMSAVKALANIGDERARPVFVRGLENPKPLIRREAAIGLIYLGGIREGDPLLEKIVASGYAVVKGKDLEGVKDRIEQGIPKY